MDQDNDALEQHWQVFQINSTTWTMRCHNGGPDAYLSAFYVPKETAESKTRPRMRRGDLTDATAYWTIRAWSNDQDIWQLSNLANGTGYNLLNNPGASIVMTDNITEPVEAGQQWHFEEIKAIDDESWSSVNVSEETPGNEKSLHVLIILQLAGTVFPTSTATSGAPTSSATATTTPSSSAEPDANNGSETSSGLSTGAKAGIGAGIGVAALIALVVLGLFLLWKRKQKQQYTRSPEKLPDNMTHVQASPFTKYELNHDDAIKHELPHNDAVSEVPVNERPAELPGHAVER